MKKLLFFLSIIFLSAISFSSCSSKSKNENNSTVICNIQGMTCSGCEQTITSKLQQLETVKVTSINHIDGTAVISYDSNEVKNEDLSKAIEDAGYKVSSIVKK